MISETSAALELLHRDADIAIGAGGRLFVVVTIRPPSGPSLRRFLDVMTARSRALQQPLLCVFVPSAPRPRLDAEARTAIRELWHDAAPLLEGCVVWIRRDSFVGALLRSLVTGLVMVQPTTILTGVVSDARAAVDSLVGSDPTLGDATRSSWAQGLERFANEHAP